jgi:hypothetical protein
LTARSPDALAAMAGLLPDLPNWVEVRSMLLHGKATLIGPVSSSPPTFVALHRDGDQAVVVGRASRAAIVEAASTADEILAATEEDASWVAGALPDWKVESALLFRRSLQSPLPKLETGEVRILETSEVTALIDGPHSTVPKTLADELRSAFSAGAPIAAAFEAGRPVAFCYAGSITETLWDVSIDTLERYRRRHHAMKAVTFLIEHYRALGRQPVWGALVSNHASAALAARLGFVPTGSLSVFSAPGVVDT